MSIPMAPSSEILIDEIKKSLIFKEKRLDYIEMEITMLNNIICSLIASGIWAMIVVIFSPQIITILIIALMHKNVNSIT